MVGDDDGGTVVPPQCYVDTLLSLRLGDQELVSLCWEFMNAAAKTTSTALEWIMARLVLHQDIQQKLWNEIAAARTTTRSAAAGGSSRRSTTTWV
jgi:cytochrome P450